MTLGSIFKGLCYIHVVKTYLINPLGTFGPSMLPTIDSTPSVFLTEKISTRFGKVDRGDIVVLCDPQKPAHFLTKRVIGLEGDRITYSTNPETKDLVDDNFTHISYPENNYMPKTVVVPKGSVWVEGDNKSDSRDSRKFGPIPYGLIYGKIFWRNCAFCSPNIQIAIFCILLLISVDPPVVNPIGSPLSFRRRGDEVVHDCSRDGGEIEGTFGTLKWRLESYLSAIDNERRSVFEAFLLSMLSFLLPLSQYCFIGLSPIICDDDGVEYVVAVECLDGVANEDVCVGDGEEELADKDNRVANEDVCVGNGEEELADKENCVGNEEVCVGDGEEALADKVNTEVGEEDGEHEVGGETGNEEDDEYEVSSWIESEGDVMNEDELYDVRIDRDDMEDELHKVSVGCHEVPGATAFWKNGVGAVLV
ncbi:mitochondrial inner membrane protease subunit 1 [Vigna unguiculata]|uniref:Mitochondrial inner membrane protease subunit 1 n=1 Tax=Vigna unguiculata TaxID=3917 RepID=A0A4D6LB60_VIGUN|nr:mitochondrial inner membrane protease subunit 1 [Vigna unguiculata]